MNLGLKKLVCGQWSRLSKHRYQHAREINKTIRGALVSRLTTSREDAEGATRNLLPEKKKIGAVTLAGLIKQGGKGLVKLMSTLCPKIWEMVRRVDKVPDNTFTSAQ
ncbi:hypothetical protein ElyMa_004541000 [Elysia marginata]|uniref:Uncharacterized protein n=1 Tax=Elysia marginata TaxID=1093978 RepID=A0AAV4HRC2_9GAST|nr:hypothetical protein ElyMa_004541000 [Elysia marginata]